MDELHALCEELSEWRGAMIGIVGPGAVGHMLSFFIQKHAQLPVQMIGRRGSQELLAEIFWDNTWHELRVEQSEQLCDLLMVVVKSYDLAAALRGALPRLKAGGVVLLLGNGYLAPLLEPWQAERPELTWRKGTVTRGVRLEAPGRFVLSAAGQVVWGSESAQLPLEREIFTRLAAFDFRWEPKICDLRKEKWFYNTVLNTLAGVYHLPRNGDALKLFAQELEILAQESFALGKELWPTWSASYPRLWNGLLHLIRATENNENSMARDVRLGRRTEAAVLSGTLELARDKTLYPLLMDFHQRLLK